MNNLYVFLLSTVLFSLTANGQNFSSPTFYQSENEKFLITTSVDEDCSVNPVITQDENSITIAINGQGAVNPLYSIDWGDGSFASNQATDTHVYAQEGEYEICIVYLDQDNVGGCYIVDCSESVTIGQEGSDPCSVDLEVVVVGQSVTATAVGAGVADGQYFIDWGDGSTAMEPSGVHLYEEEGTYSICVSYGQFIPGGCTASDCEEVVIEIIECTLTLIPINEGNLEVLITAMGNGAAIPNYSIDWGDGTEPGIISADSHIYSEGGVYLICVTYSDSSNPDNCMLIECVNVEVAEEAPCSVDLIVTSDGNISTANAIGEGAINPQYVINWGDNTTPTVASNGTHTYLVPGDYTVCVTYTDLNATGTCLVYDCEDISIVLHVSDSINASPSLSLYPNPVSENMKIVFYQQTPGEVELELFDLMGKKVQTIFAGKRAQGIHSLDWNSSELTPSVYFIRMTSDNSQRSIKVIKK